MDSISVTVLTLTLFSTSKIVLKITKLQMFSVDYKTASPLPVIKTWTDNQVGPPKMKQSRGSC